MNGALAPMDGTGDLKSWEGKKDDAASCWKVTVRVEAKLVLWNKLFDGT